MKPEISEIRARLNENPGDALALKGASSYYLGEGYYRQAQNTYAQALKCGPRLLAGILLDYEKAIAEGPEKIGPRLSFSGFLLSAGEIDGAILELEELLEVSPQNTEAYNALGRIYIQQDRIDDAIALLERSIASGVRDVRLTETLAGAYLEKGREKEAIGFYEELLSQKPGDKQTLRILGELYTRGESYNQAAQKYAAMFSDDPEVVREVIGRLEELLRRVEGNIEIRETLADVYMKTLNPDSAVIKLREIIRLESTKLGDAVSKLRAILRSYPNHPAASLALAEALRRQGNYSEAVEHYQQILKEKPELVDEVTQGYREVLEVCPDQVLARAYLGEALLLKNLIPEALSEFGRMIEHDPSAAETVIRKCREILRREPQLLAAHVVLGQAYLAKGDYQRAAVEAEGVIAADKNLTSAYLVLGEACARMNFPRKAGQALRTAMLLDPYDMQVHERYRQVREREVAQEIETQKDRFSLARLYLEVGNREAAVRELQAAGRTAPVLNLLGDIYRSEGRYDIAAAQYNHALELAAPDISKTVRFNLGTTHEAQGQVRKAIKLYEQISQEDIDFGNLKKRIKKLKATSLANMRNLPLLAVISDFGKRNIIGLWGWEGREGARGGRREEVSVSFGQEHNQEGFEFFIRGMFPAAEEELALAVQLDRRFGAAINNLGVALAKQGKFEEARLRLGEAVQADPASPVFYNNLGAVYFLLGKIDPAQTAFEKALALDPDSPALLINLGDLYYFKSEPQKAIELYRKVGSFDTLSDLAASRLRHKTP